MFRNLEELVEAARAQGPAHIAIAVAQDPDVVEAMKQAEEMGLAKGIFVGDSRKICGLAEAAGFKIPDAQLISEPDNATAGRKAIALVRDGRAQLLMKGKIKSMAMEAKASAVIIGAVDTPILPNTPFSPIAWPGLSPATSTSRAVPTGW